MQNIDLNKATQPYEYYMKHIKENRRPDGRKLSEIRPCSVKPECIQNTTNGSSIVRLFDKTPAYLKFPQLIVTKTPTNSFMFIVYF